MLLHHLVPVFGQRHLVRVDVQHRDVLDENAADGAANHQPDLLHKFVAVADVQRVLRQLLLAPQLIDRDLAAGFLRLELRLEEVAVRHVNLSVDGDLALEIVLQVEELHFRRVQLVNFAVFEQLVEAPADCGVPRIVHHVGGFDVLRAQLALLLQSLRQRHRELRHGSERLLACEFLTKIGRRSIAVKVLLEAVVVVDGDGVAIARHGWVLHGALHVDGIELALRFVAAHHASADVEANIEAVVFIVRRLDHVEHGVVLHQRLHFELRNVLSFELLVVVLQLGDGHGTFAGDDQRFDGLGEGFIGWRSLHSDDPRGPVR